MMKRTAVIFLLAGLALSVSAQRNQIQSQANYAAFYNFSDAGDVTIQVSAWGAVRFPGLYEVPRNVKLMELYSLTGGPTMGERLRRSKRTLTVELHRIIDGVDQVIFRDVMENEINVSAENFQLMDGDVLSVQQVTRQTFSIRDIFPILSAALTAVILVDNLRN